MRLMPNMLAFIAAVLLAAPPALAQQEPPAPDPQPGPSGGESGKEKRPAPPRQAHRISGAANFAADDESLPPGFGTGRVEQPVNTTDLISRFHPLVVHFTIGWLFLLFFVDLATFLGKITEWRRAGPLLLLATIVSAIPSLVTGLMREGFVGGFFKQQLVGLHENVMFAMIAACVLAFAVRVRARNRLGGGAAALYMLLIATAVFLVAVGGHLGAKMVYGPNYLPF